MKPTNPELMLPTERIDTNVKISPGVVIRQTQADINFVAAALLLQMTGEDMSSIQSSITREDGDTYSMNLRLKYYDPDDGILREVYVKRPCRERDLDTKVVTDIRKIATEGAITSTTFSEVRLSKFEARTDRKQETIISWTNSQGIEEIVYQPSPGDSQKTTVQISDQQPINGARKMHQDFRDFAANELGFRVQST